MLFLVVLATFVFESDAIIRPDVFPRPLPRQPVGPMLRGSAGFLGSPVRSPAVPALSGPANHFNGILSNSGTFPLNAGRIPMNAARRPRNRAPLHSHDVRIPPNVRNPDRLSPNNVWSGIAGGSSSMVDGFSRLPLPGFNRMQGGFNNRFQRNMVNFGHSNGFGQNLLRQQFPRQQNPRFSNFNRFPDTTNFGGISNQGFPGNLNSRQFGSSFGQSANFANAGLGGSSNFGSNRIRPVRSNNNGFPSNNGGFSAANFGFPGSPMSGYYRHFDEFQRNGLNNNGFDSFRSGLRSAVLNDINSDAFRQFPDLDEARWRRGHNFIGHNSDFYENILDHDIHDNLEDIRDDLRFNRAAINSFVGHPQSAVNMATRRFNPRAVPRSHVPSGLPSVSTRNFGVGGAPTGHSPDGIVTVATRGIGAGGALPVHGAGHIFDRRVADLLDLNDRIEDRIDTLQDRIEDRVERFGDLFNRNDGLSDRVEDRLDRLEDRIGNRPGPLPPVQRVVNRDILDKPHVVIALNGPSRNGGSRRELVFAGDSPIQGLELLGSSSWSDILDELAIASAQHQALDYIPQESVPVFPVNPFAGTASVATEDKIDTSNRDNGIEVGSLSLFGISPNAIRSEINSKDTTSHPAIGGSFDLQHPPPIHIPTGGQPKTTSHTFHLGSGDDDRKTTITVETVQESIPANQNNGAGLSGTGQGIRYANAFPTGPGQDIRNAAKDLVAAGLAQDGFVDLNRF